MVKLADVHAARGRIQDGIVQTPCKPTQAFGDDLPCKLFWKFENLQRTGSFKDRGALNKLLQQGATLSDGLKEVHRLAEEEGMILVHAFDDEKVIAGQGTIGLELLEQVPDLDTVIVPLAALLAGKIPVADQEQVVGVLCGGNIDVNMISRIIERGLVGDGRMTHLVVKVRDRPGSLSFLTDLVADMGANVLDIHHRRGFADISVGDVEIVLQIETRGSEHVEDIIRSLEDRGVTVEVDV
jgi:threonine dehydratase